MSEPSLLGFSTVRPPSAFAEDERMRPVLLTLSLLVAGAAAHMPAGAGSGTREEPVDLGDTTTNSWALTGELNPGEVKHYKVCALVPCAARVQPLPRRADAASTSPLM